MNMAREPETLVQNLLSEQLHVRFASSSTLPAKWGRTDGEVQLSDSTILLLEVESTQKHPSTNVLKIWPLLETNNEVSILLVHAFFPDSPGLAGSRGELASWLAKKIETTIGNRFSYHRIVVSREGQPLHGFSELQAAIMAHSENGLRVAQPIIPPDMSLQVRQSGEFQR